MDLLHDKVPVSDGGRRRSVTRLAAVLLTQWHRAIKDDERATQAFLAFATTLGAFEKSETIEPSRWWTDKMLFQLNREELEQVMKLDEKRRALFEELHSR
jgi:hypothetical protein